MNRMLFRNRAEFRAWLAAHALSDEGIWLVFGKTARVKTLTAREALEEALCFGWIDGRMQSVDRDTYIKYFKQRSRTSNWSERNRELARQLESRGLMTESGRAKIEIARQNGSRDSSKPGPLSDDQLRSFEALLQPHGAALANFAKMPPSMRRTYASSYLLGAKTDEGKRRRLAAIVERLELNLNPMESLKSRQTK